MDGLNLSTLVAVKEFYKRIAEKMTNLVILTITRSRRPVPLLHGFRRNPGPKQPHL